MMGRVRLTALQSSLLHDFLHFVCVKDPERAIVEWVEKMFADRRSSPSAAPDLTPLHMAIYKQHPDIARLLIDKGADIITQDYFGLTRFMLCALRSMFASFHVLPSGTFMLCSAKSISI